MVWAQGLGCQWVKHSLIPAWFKVFAILEKNMGLLTVYCTKPLCKVDIQQYVSKLCLVSTGTLMKHSPDHLLQMKEDHIDP